MSQEVEIRFKIEKNKKEEIFSKFGGWKKLNQFDKYYKNKNREGIMRIRKEGNKTELSYKWFTDNKDGWGEIETPMECNIEKLEKIFKKAGYKKDLEINKIRFSNKVDNIEINVDNVKNLGWFCELEVINGTKEELNRLAGELGIKENKIIDTGYVQLLNN